MIIFESFLTIFMEFHFFEAAGVVEDIGSSVTPLLQNLSLTRLINPICSFCQMSEIWIGFGLSAMLRDAI